MLFRSGCSVFLGHFRGCRGTGVQFVADGSSGSRVVRLVHHWFTTGTLWFASGSTGSLWFAGGSSGSRLVRVVHRWFKWFTTGSRSSGVVDVVRAHNLMGSVESQPAESRGEWSVSMFIQC